MEEVLHKLLQAKREFGWRDEGMLIVRHMKQSHLIYCSHSLELSHRIPSIWSFFSLRNLYVIQVLISKNLTFEKKCYTFGYSLDLKDAMRMVKRVLEQSSGKTKGQESQCNVTDCRCANFFHFGKPTFI